MKAALLSPKHFRRTRWKNGRGWSNDIAVSPDGEQRWPRMRWLLTLSDIAGDAPFSDLAGFERSFLVAAGKGVELSFADGRRVRLLRNRRAFAFDGGSAPACRVLDGPVQALNIMTRRGRAAHRVRLQRVPRGKVEMRFAAGTSFLYPLDAALAEVPAGHALRIDGPGRLELNVRRGGMVYRVAIT
jgi:uncharacterized protein